MASTPIRTTQGEVAIADLRIGDRVVAVSVFGEIVDVKVNALIVHTDSPITELETEAGVLRTTEDHPFWVGRDEYIAVANLKVGDMIVQLSGDEIRYVEIKSIRRNTSKETTYNLSVDAPNTYVAGGMVVHNMIIKEEAG